MSTPFRKSEIANAKKAVKSKWNTYFSGMVFLHFVSLFESIELASPHSLRPRFHLLNVQLESFAILRLSTGEEKVPHVVTTFIFI